MISFATDGGGVGPHFDSYDVFLLQAQGQRRWKIGAQQDLSLVEGMPLKILANFKPKKSSCSAGRHALPAAPLRPRRRGRSASA
jgi:ribosomal protein L16 Arg81 hydroxylase